MSGQSDVWANVVQQQLACKIVLSSAYCDVEQGVRFVAVKQRTTEAAFTRERCPTKQCEVQLCAGETMNRLYAVAQSKIFSDPDTTSWLKRCTRCTRCTRQGIFASQQRTYPMMMLHPSMHGEQLRGRVMRDLANYETRRETIWPI